MDGITSVAKVQSRFVVGKVRWRPGFPSQIAFCSSAIDPMINLYDLMDPIRPIQRFYGHSDVVRDFDWLDSDAIISCGTDKKLILSIWEDLPKPLRRVQTSSCTYIPNIRNVSEAAQKVAFNLSHEFSKKVLSGNSAGSNEYSSIASLDQGSGRSTSLEIRDSELSGEFLEKEENETSKFRSEIKELLGASNSVFRFCSERNEFFKYSLYSISGFLPDIGLTPFPGDLASVLDPRCELERRLHIHKLANRKSDWLELLHKLKTFGVAPSWSLVLSKSCSLKIEGWLRKWGSFVLESRIDLSRKGKSGIISSGKGEDLSSFLFNTENLKKLNSCEKIKCVFEFFLEAMNINILENSNSTFIEGNRDNPKETLKGVLEELKIQSSRNNLVVCLIIVQNLLPSLVPPESKILRTFQRMQLKWTLSLVALLRKFGLFCLSLQIIKASPFKEVRNLARENISESNFYCGTEIKINTEDSGEPVTICKKAIKSEKPQQDGRGTPIRRTDLHFCSDCHSVKNVCVLCREPVFGLWVGCPFCKHGGHPGHIKEWFQSNSVCPSGCGHFCLVTETE
ncbi:GATOR complex protein WDR24-like [Cryptosporidium felis]|nr:GATOR complex protein WDR24-like [Cryptosporidium felis]